MEVQAAWEVGELEALARSGLQIPVVLAQAPVAEVVVVMFKLVVPVGCTVLAEVVEALVLVAHSLVAQASKVLSSSRIHH